MIKCADCGVEITPDNAYLRRGGKGGMLAVCKSCQKKRSARSARARRARGFEPTSESGEAGEVAVQRYLERRGIPIIRHAGDVAYDLLAWGCVRIEVKSASPRRERRDRVQYLWCFSPDQLEREPADVVVLMTLDDGELFFFPGEHPVFTWQKVRGGRRKSAVAWTTPQPRAYGRDNTETYLSGDLMAAQRGAYDVIELSRLLQSFKLQRRREAEDLPIMG